MKKPADPFLIFGDAIAIGMSRVAHASPASVFGQAAVSPGQPLSAPAFVHLLPPSGFTGRDGRGPFYYSFPTLAKAFSARGLKLAIDLEHASLVASKTGAAAPAVGWITDLQLTDTGVFGKVEWTEAGRGLVESGGFKYLSPVFESEHMTGGRIHALLGAGLTHLPNLSLKPVTMKELKMNDEILALLLEILDLQKDSEPAKILAALTALQTELADLRSLFANGNDDDDDEGEGEGEGAGGGGSENPQKGVFGALSAMRQEQARLTKTVMAFSSALTAQKQEAHLTACAQAVDDAITAGKIPPAHRAYHFSAAKRDLEAFNAFVAKCQPFPGFVQKNSQKGGTKDTANKSPFDVALKRV